MTTSLSLSAATPNQKESSVFTPLFVLIALVLTIGSLVSNLVRKNAQKRLMNLSCDTDEEFALHSKVSSKMYTASAFLNIQLFLLAVCLIAFALYIFSISVESTPVSIPTPIVVEDPSWDFYALADTGEAIHLTVTGEGGDCIGKVLAGDSTACGSRLLQIDSHSSKVWIEGRQPKPELTPDPNVDIYVVVGFFQLNKLEEHPGIRFDQTSSYEFFFVTDNDDAAANEWPHVYHDLTLLNIVP